MRFLLRLRGREQSELIARADPLWSTSAARRDSLGRGLAAEHAIAGRGKAANQPVGLDGVLHPGACPAAGHAGLDGVFRHFPPLQIEKRQLSAGLRQSPLQIAPLRLARPYASRITAGLTRRADAVFALPCSTHLARPPLTMIKDALTSGF